MSHSRGTGCTAMATEAMLNASVAELRPSRSVQFPWEGKDCDSRRGWHMARGLGMGSVPHGGRGMTARVVVSSSAYLWAKWVGKHPPKEKTPLDIGNRPAGMHWT